KVKDFQKAISKFVSNAGKGTGVATSTLAAYAQLGVYDDNVKKCLDDQLPLEVQFHALNVIKSINDKYLDDNEEKTFSRSLADILTKKLQNKSNKNAVRIWSFQALFTPLFYNPQLNPDTADKLEDAIGDLLKEKLNQVNGFIWSKLKYSATDRLCPLRGIAARLRATAPRDQYSQIGTFTSREVKLSLPVGRKFIAKIDLQAIFENDRATPAFLSAKICFDGIKVDTSRVTWIDFAVIIENLDWNLAEYLIRLDPLANNTTPEEKEKVKNTLPSPLKRLQEKRDQEEDPDPSVHLYLKFFGADLRVKDITDKVQDVLKTNLRTFIRNQLMNSMKDIADKKPLFRIPLEVGAAIGASNGLTLHKSCQVGFLGDLSYGLENTRDATNVGKFSLKNTGALSFSLTCQREVAAPWSRVGETMNYAGLSSVPFEYRYEGTKNGRSREFNLLNTESTLLSTDFDYAIRTSKGLKRLVNPPAAALDPSCLPSSVYRVVGANICLKLNPFRSIKLGRVVYPLQIQIRKDPSIKAWRAAWRVNENNSPQYEVGLEKLGATTYPGLGVKATKTGNNFDIEVLTGMKSFNVKGTQNANQFDGKVYDDKNKEVMGASGTLTTGNDQLKLDVKLTDNQSKKEILTLTTDLSSSNTREIKVDVKLGTPDQKKTFNIHFDGDFYKTNSKLFHLSGGFNLPDISYDGKVHLQNDSSTTKIELKRTVKLKTGKISGYDFVYSRKKPKQGEAQREHDIQSHLTIRSPQSDQPVKVYDFDCQIKRALDHRNFIIHSTLDLDLVTRQPSVQEHIEFDYVRRSVRPSSQDRRLVSPQADLKVELKTKSQVLGLLLDHHHKKSDQPAKKGDIMQAPTFEINNKIHVAIATNKLFPNTPRPVDVDVLSQFNWQYLNELDYTFKYVNKRTQRDAELTYTSKVNKVTMDHLYNGTGSANIHWNSKTGQITTKDTFSICTRAKSLRVHSDIDTNWDKDNIQLDFEIRKSGPQQQSMKQRHRRELTSGSRGVDFNLTLASKRTSGFQYLDVSGILQLSKEIINIEKSIAWKVNNTLKEIDLNVDINFDSSRQFTKSHAELLLPLQRVSLISNDIVVERTARGGITRVTSKTNAQPLFSHNLDIGVTREEDRPPYVTADSLVTCQRNDDDYVLRLGFGLQRWKTVRTCGELRRNADLLFSHDIGYELSKKTKRAAFSIESPMLTKSNGLTMIGELTIDKENRLGKSRLPKEFGVHLELGTPLTNKAALKLKYDIPAIFQTNRSIDGKFSVELALQRGRSFSFDWDSSGSLASAFNILSSASLGDDASVTALISAQCSTTGISQLTSKVNGRYFGQIFEKSVNALYKHHEISIKGEVRTPNNTNRPFFKYNISATFDDNELIGHIQRTDMQQTIDLDVTAKTCGGNNKGKGYCYSGDAVVKTTNDQRGKKGNFDISWGKSSVKWNMNVPEAISITVDHTHTGQLKTDDFTSKTKVDAKLLISKSEFHYDGSGTKDDGKWNALSFKTYFNDDKTGEKVANLKLDYKSDIADKREGSEQRTLSFSLDRVKQIDWSSKSTSCLSNPSKVVYGICRKSTFDVKTNSQLAQLFRKRLMLPDDPKLANVQVVNYDGTFDLDLKHDPNLGPHTIVFDLNRLKEDSIELNLSLQPRTDSKTMGITVTGKLPRNDPISIKYDETSKTRTSYSGTLKYSFNANDKNAEKTYTCAVEKPADNVLNVNCNGERTKLTINIDGPKHIRNAYVDLNKYDDERVGFESAVNTGTNQVDVTLYTFVNTWKLQRQPQKWTTITVKQKGKEVYRVEGKRVSNQEIEVKFLPKNINLKLTWDNATTIQLQQTQPQQRNLLTVTLDRKTLRRYLPNLRSRNIPDLDIDQEPQTKIANIPLFEIVVDPAVVVRLSQATEKFGAHHGKGLDIIKKRFNLELGEKSLSLYNTQHWKTHFDDISFPESYILRLYNNENKNFIQLSAKKWDETHYINEIGHSIDGSKTLTTDLSLDRDYAHKVGMLYFFHSKGIRNPTTAKELRNQTRSYLVQEFKGVKTSNAVQLVKGLRESLRDIFQVDYAAVKQIVQNWSKEPEKSVLRRLSETIGLTEFFTKYPTYRDFSNNAQQAISERHQERMERLLKMVVSSNTSQRLFDLSTRFNQGRNKLIERLSARLEGILNRTMPVEDQAQIDKRVEQTIQNLLQGFQGIVQRTNDRWKAIFKQIDESTKGDDMKWFRQLIADIDSAAMNSAMDTESTKMFKRLSDSSKLLTSNVVKLSRGISQRREQFRNRLRNAIRHIPKLMINETQFEVLLPYGTSPATYNSLPISVASVLSLLSNRKRMNVTVSAVISEFFASRRETIRSYRKFIKAIGKRLFQRNPSLTPERVAVITSSGHGIDLHGDYIYLNPACDYILLHDFVDLQFSFQYANGKVYSVVPSPRREVPNYECSASGRVQACCEKDYCRINVPVHYGGRADGALGDVRDRSNTEPKLTQWLNTNCGGRENVQKGAKKADSTIPECDDDNDEIRTFCENFVQDGLKNNKDRRQLIFQAKMIQNAVQ
ncbi:unnamed protein product, partial [Didymodactylos carnosus]